MLAGSFAVCGASTNGLVGTHFIAYCGDRGIAPVAAAGLVTPWLAALGMALSSLLVTGNALRLTRGSQP